MSTEVSSHAEETSPALTLIRHRQRETLRECVVAALDSYFLQIGDHRVHHLYRMVISEVESPLLETVLAHTKGNQTKAAAILGMSRSTLRKKLAQYNLD